MLRASWSELDLECLWSGDQLVFICFRIDRYFGPCCLVYRVLDPESPKQPREHTPLRAFSEVYAGTYASASTVSVMIAILVVGARSIFCRQAWMVQETIGIVEIGLFVTRMAEGPVGNHDRGIFGLCYVSRKSVHLPKSPTISMPSYQLSSVQRCGIPVGTLSTPLDHRRSSTAFGVRRLTQAGCAGLLS